MLLMVRENSSGNREQISEVRSMGAETGVPLKKETSQTNIKTIVMDIRSVPLEV